MIQILLRYLFNSINSYSDNTFYYKLRRIWYDGSSILYKIKKKGWTDKILDFIIFGKSIDISFDGYEITALADYYGNVQRKTYCNRHLKYINTEYIHNYDNKNICKLSRFYEYYKLI